MFNRFISYSTVLILSSVLFCIGCSAQQTEEQALESLRQLTKDGKLPAESVAEQIERRFAGKQTGVLARLLRARIKFESKDFAGAASLLDSNDFATKTKLGDYALWLRGQALQSAGNHPAAIDVFAKLEQDFPNSVRAKDARLRRGESAIAAGRSALVPEMLAELAASGDAEALILTARAYESNGEQANAIKYYRETYFVGPGSLAAKDAEVKLTSLGQPLIPSNSEEAIARAEKLFAARNFLEADKELSYVATNYPRSLTPELNLKTRYHFGQP